MSDDTMTLAFDVKALDNLRDPSTVFEDARQWSTFVGVVSDKMAYQVVNYLRERNIYNEDFFSRVDKRRGLEHISDQTDTDRHVFVGHCDEDERIARETGWEYLTIEEAADEAGWDLLSEPVEQ